MPKGVYKRTEETKKKISEAKMGMPSPMKGRKHSEEAKKKIGKANKGKLSFRKGKKDIYSKETLKKMSEAHKGKIISEETKKKLSLLNSGKNNPNWGKPRSKESRKKISEANLGKKISLKTRIKISNSNKGKKSRFWKGGITPLNEKIRRGIEYRLWREAIFARDNWTCQKYGIKGGRLHSHHVQNFAKYPELRFAIDNGITLSKKAHEEFHKKYGRKNNTKEQLEEFLSIPLKD